MAGKRKNKSKPKPLVGKLKRKRSPNPGRINVPKGKKLDAPKRRRRSTRYLSPQALATIGIATPKILKIRSRR